LTITSGISSAYGGPLSALDIQYSLTPSTEETAAGVKLNKLVEREVITAVYEHSQKVLVRKERLLDLP
jgi:hypothetical protein